MSKCVNAANVIVRDQFVCQGATYMNGGMMLGSGATISVRDGPTFTFDRAGIHASSTRSQSAPVLVIGSDGIHAQCGITIGTDIGAPTVRGITRDLSRDDEIDDEHVPTSRAVREYIDAQRVGVHFAHMTVNEIGTSREGEPIRVDAPVSFTGPVTFSGSIRASFARLTTMGAIIDCNKYSLFFLDGAPSVECGAPTVAGHVAYTMQLINTSFTMATVVRFEQGCATIGARNAAKFMYCGSDGSSVASTSGWMCLANPNDVFYPTRATIHAVIPRAESIAISANGRLVLIGTPSDGARGGVHITLANTFAHTNSWVHAQINDGARSCNKLVAQNGYADMRGQGRTCAANEDGSIIAIANDRALWVYSVAIAAAEAHSLPSSEVTVRVTPVNGDAIVPDPNGRIMRATLRGHTLEIIVVSATGAITRATYGDVLAKDGMTSESCSECASVPDSRICASFSGATSLAPANMSATCQEIVVSRTSEVARIRMEKALRSCVLCADGSFGLACLIDGSVWSLF
jgi:hypothetical protein